MENSEIILVPGTKRMCEVRADREFLYIQKNNQIGRLPLSELEHCIVSGDGDYRFRISTHNGKYLEFDVTHKHNTASALFHWLEAYCSGFRNRESTYSPYTWTLPNMQCRIDRNELAVDTKRVFRSGTKPMYRIPLRDITKVVQFHNVSDPETGDLFTLRIYTVPEKFHSFTDISGQSIEQCYEIALMLKDNAPQVQYCIYADMINKSK